MGGEKKQLEEPTTKDLDLKEVRRVWSLAEADIIKSYLESNGISCVYRTLAAPFVYVFTTDGMGEIKIMVKGDDYEAAMEMLESHETDGESGPENEK